MSAYDPFAAVYDEWSLHMTEDVAHYVRLAREAPPGPIVELAVGNGRVAIPVARETGRALIGIDASAAMLAMARERADAAGVELELRHGDMRDLELAEPAVLVTCPFRSLLHLPTWADKRRLFERVAASLAPGGRFAWNAFAFDYSIAAHNEGDDLDNPVPHRLHHSPADNRIDITRLETGDSISLWWCTQSEWRGLIDVAGLEVEALYGGFRQEPFTEESREFVWVARKPG